MLIGMFEWRFVMYFPVTYNDDDLLSDFNDPFDFPFRRRHSVFGGKKASHLMSTDVRELSDAYEYDIDLPGFKKEEIQATLKNGMLTVSASKTATKDERKENGHYLCRERYSGSCSRSFYVGESVKEEDVKAKFENGILSISIPKKETVEPKHKAIMIS